MTTMEDVAKLAGVSSITVSRVINNSAPVNDLTRQRVIKAIEQLNYVPNVLARSFRSKRTGLLALVVNDIINPFWTRVIQGAEVTAREQGYHLILCNTDDVESKQNKNLNMLVQRQIDGIILVPASPSADSINTILRQGTPIVLMDCFQIPGTQVDIVRGDSEGGAFQLMELLTALGHRHIAILNGPMSYSSSIERLQGYQKALHNAKIELDDKLIFEGDFTIDSGYKLAQQAMQANPRPTALFATNNFILFGAYRGVRDVGLRVPADLALVGFDDIPDYLTIDPFFTVVAQPAYEMGKKAMGLLIDRVEERATADYHEIVMPTQLLVRESSGHPLGKDSS